MTKNTKKIILFNIALLFLAISIIVLYLFNKGPDDVSRRGGIEATPDELYTSYIKDSVLAHKKYDGKVLRITGEVSEVTQNAQKQQIVLLKTSNSGGNINCTMEVAIPNIKAGDMVTIKGICSGMGQGDVDLGILGDVYLTRSIISN